jgi:signal transduction histidine kinase
LIHESGEHLLDLINDLLDLAKIEAGKQELNKTTVDVAELCQSAIEMIAVRAIAKQQNLSLILPVAVESVVIDQQRVLQILLNYLSNAVKFTPEGGAITLSSRLADRQELEAATLPVEVSEKLGTEASTDCRFLVLSVSDTGMGIPLEKQSILFQRFHQIEGASEYQRGGSGLGLALSKQLAELHGGRVSLTSTTGLGSTFSVWLPC